MPSTSDMFPFQPEDHVFTPEESFAEASEWHTYIDVSSYIDEKGLKYVLQQITKLIDSPQEQHLANRLLTILTENEASLLSHRKEWWQ